MTHESQCTPQEYTQGFSIPSCYSKGRWESPVQVPFNFTEMEENVIIPDNAEFKQVKPWEKNATKADGTEADPQDPEVYFVFCFCCDKDPDTILQ